MTRIPEHELSPGQRAALAARNPPAPTQARVTLPCAHVGAPSGPKGWHLCEHPDEPLGQTVCACKGCGPRCPGYTPAAPPFEKPWGYAVTVAVPHLDTPELLPVVLDLWRHQTVRPYLLVVDTGSRDPAALDRFRAADCEVHLLRGGPWPHTSYPVGVALDAAHALCRTPLLVHTHTDLFPRRPDLLAHLLSLCGPASPVVGWRMSPRTKGDWHSCVSHTATALHLPTARRLGLSWSMERWFDAHPLDRDSGAGGWPDTESAFGLACAAAGVKPVLLGDETNDPRQDTEWWTHARSYTCLAAHAAGSPRHREARRVAAAALAEARERLARPPPGDTKPPDVGTSSRVVGS